MIQELHAAEPIYSISGFCDPRRGLFVARGARKVLQWPRQAGVGIAFEDAPLDDPLAEGVRRLCAATGFFGVFEAEFVNAGCGMSLIDFNPRIFNQVGFDVARGLPSPYFAYLLAIGDTGRLEVAVEAARAWRPDSHAVFEHGSMVAWTRVVERIVGKTTERRSSPQANGARTSVVEAATDPDQLGSILKHPRATLRAASRGYG
jgi:hypothetical protein